MIYFRNVNLSFLDNKLFDNVNWTIRPKSRIGLVGNNGAGKTTLFRAILGEVHLDAGFIDIPDRKLKTIGYLPQEIMELESKILLEFLKEKSGITALEESIRNLENQISHVKHNTFEYSQLSNTYSEALAHYTSRDGYAFEAKAKQVLKGFAFREDDFARNCESFSGGWKMRILLTSILLAQPQIMLLDEPTNHLDTESMEWLESYLKNYPGTIIVVSHDRFFLDKIATQIAELSSRRIHIYKGNYSYYLNEKQRRHASLKKEMDLQKAQIKKIEGFVERFRYKATKASQVQSRIKMLEKYQDITLEPKEKSLTMKFPEGKKSAKEVIKAINLGHNYGKLSVFRGLNFTLYRGDKVAFVGVNGSGKSTLSRLLSLTEKPASGTVKHGDNVNIAFYSQESSENLNYEKTIWEEINNVSTKANDQEKRNLLGSFLFSGDDIYKPVSILSGGEKSRLSLLKIMLLDTNFLILDEPTNHLDSITKDIFQEALINYSGTVVIVSHDRYFLDRLVNKIFELKDGSINDYFGNYSYFIEKRIQPISEFKNDEDSKISGKEQAFKIKDKKRMEAEERNKFFKIKSAWRKELIAAEENIKSLEARKSEYEQTLCDPQTLKDSSRIKKLNIDLRNISSELEHFYNIWTELSYKLEQLTTGNIDTITGEK